MCGPETTFMPVRRYWPRTDRWLLYGNLVVYVTALALVATFHGELGWAVKALDGYLRTGDYSPTADRLLVGEAMRYGNTHEGDFDGVAVFLEQAVEIDPNGHAVFLLAGLEASRGEDELALALYERYLSIDPYAIQVYAAMAAILDKRGDLEAADRLLADGVELFRGYVVRQEPRLDPTVPVEFNQKASRIHQTAEQGLEQLEHALARVRQER